MAVQLDSEVEAGPPDDGSAPGVRPNPGRAEVMRAGWRIVTDAARLHPWPLAISVVGATVFALMSIAAAIVQGWVTDEVVVPAFVPGGTRPALAGAVAAIIGVALLKALGVMVRRYFAAMTVARMQRTLRDRLVDLYLDAPLGFYARHPTGELLAHADADVNLATEMINPLPFGLGVIVLVVGSLVALFVTDPWLGLVAVALFPVLGLMNHVYAGKVEAPAASAQEAIGAVSAVAHESIDGVIVVKTLGREAAEVDRLAAEADRLRRHRVRIGELRAVFEPLVDALPNLGIIALLVIGAFRIDSGHITPGDLVRAMALFQILAFPIRVLGYLFEEIPPSVVARRRVDGTLSEETERHDHRTVALPGGPLDLTYEGLSFRFPGADSDVLVGVDATVPAGEVVALVGSTGSGKTTMCQLAARLMEPTGGRIELGGVPLDLVRPADLQRDVALVFQETFLFSGSIRDNITLGSDHTASEVEEAARIAGAHGFITEFPSGYDTVVGERGVTLSGGQRQRVALARALIRGPRLLILDDATSAVDPIVEGEILAGLREALGTTTLIVAQRVSTIALADRVLFLSGGRIRAAGTHAELLAVPAYEALVRAYEETGGVGVRP